MSVFGWGFGKSKKIVNRYGKDINLLPRTAPESNIDFLLGNGTDLSRRVRIQYSQSLKSSKTTDKLFVENIFSYFVLFAYFDTFPQHNVEGLLLSWPLPCLSSLSDFLFVYPLGKTAAVVFVFVNCFSIVF